MVQNKGLFLLTPLKKNGFQYSTQIQKSLTIKWQKQKWKKNDKIDNDQLYHLLFILLFQVFVHFTCIYLYYNLR